MRGDKWAAITNLTFCVSSGYGNHYWRWLDGLYYWDQTSTGFGYTTTCAANVVSLLDANYSAVEWDGLAQITVIGTTTVNAWAYLNYFYTQTYDTNATISVAAHELGHVLGLNHEVGAVLMNVTTGDRYYTLGVFLPQQDDVNGINAMY